MSGPGHGTGRALGATREARRYGSDIDTQNDPLFDGRAEGGIAHESAFRRETALVLLMVPLALWPGQSATEPASLAASGLLFLGHCVGPLRQAAGSDRCVGPLRRATASGHCVGPLRAGCAARP